MNDLVIIALGVALLWSIAPIIHKAVLNKVTPRMLLIFNGITIGIIVLIYALLNKDAVLQEASELSRDTIGWMLIAVTLSWFLAPLIFYSVLQKGTGHIIIALAYSSPLFAMILAWLFLREKITLMSFIGVCLIVIGIVFLAVAHH